MTELYHALNRGVDKRNVVLDDHDRLRFINNLYVFNDSQASINAQQPNRFVEHRQRDLLVHIYAYCLMNNHYHILLSEAQAGGMAQFMKKINMGYTKYFNERYARTGTLWQGKYKKLLVTSGAYELYIPYYIHLNPLDYAFPTWRKGLVKTVRGALSELRTYKWSSHLDYLGGKNFPSIIRTDPDLQILSNHKSYEREISGIISSGTLTLHSDVIE